MTVLEDSKAKQEKNKSENEIAAKEFEQQHKTNSKSSPAVSNEIKLTSPTLLATKVDISDLDFSQYVCYAFVFKQAFFHLRNCLLLCLLLSLTFCSCLLTSFHKTCHRNYHLLEGLSI